MLPNFLIIGAYKAGSTSLYQYCKEHPQIFMTRVKEPNFLGYCETQSSGNMNFPIRTISEYRSLFNDVTDEKAIGEASPLYLNSQVAIKKIKQYLPDARFIVSLRNPVDRAYSAYLMAVRNGRETRTAREALDLSTPWIKNGLYYESLRNYIDVFGNDRIKITLFDDLKSDALTVMQGIFSFLEVNHEFKPEVSYRHNPGGIPKNKLYHSIYEQIKRSEGLKRVIPERLCRIARRLRDRNLEATVGLDEDLRSEWIDYFREDVLRLQVLIQTDLSVWLSKE